MRPTSAGLATLGDLGVDLTARLAEARRQGIVDLTPPDGKRVVLPREVVRTALESGAAHASGAFGSAGGLVARAAVLAGRPVLYLVADAEAAVRAHADLELFLGHAGARVLSLLPPDSSPWAEVNPDRRGGELRLATLSHLGRGLPFAALVAPIGALGRRVVPRDVVLAHGISVSVNDTLDRDDLARRLVDSGYARAALVEDPGTFALRGGLFDAWSPGSARPVRVELFGDGVLAIREFDPEDQRTLGQITDAHFVLAREMPLDRKTADRAQARMRAIADDVNLPTARARALVQDVSTGRAFPGSDGYLPAFVDLAPLSTYLPDDLVVVLEDPAEIVRASRDEDERALVEAEKKRGSAHFPYEAFYVPARDVERAILSRPHVCLHRVATVGTSETSAYPLAALDAPPLDCPTLHVADHADLERAMKSLRGTKSRRETLEPLCDRIALWHEHGLRTAIVARAETQLDRIASLLDHRRIETQRAAHGLDAAWLDRDGPGEPGPVVLAQGSLARGLAAPAAGLVLVTEEEIFGHRSGRRSRKAEGRTSQAKARAFIQSLQSLTVGDLVVHVEHGIGRYQGLVHREVGASRVDLVVIEYAGGDKLYLPVYRLSLIDRYAGGDGAPKLDRLGGQTFAKSKARAEREVRKMADELLRLYAERRAVTREPLTTPDDTYRAFEATFPFEETPDQARAIEEVERDLEDPVPMDRLVCGDVGFGKTEIAIRAAFRVAASGRQVAILCPTTVLAQQHYLGFVARMNDHPLVVRALSRFTKKSDEDETLRGLRAGSVDIVIGTHRLLSKDVHYKKLGLLVVDEEQRFGVTHKERIKQIRASVDVLTLTATPIPRTLQMAISGIRDMSVILTAPVDRRAIRTTVTRWDADVLKGAIERELGRGGQVYYVHNRIEHLYERAQRLAELVPGARIAVAHGQMADAALERTMIDFVEGQFDVLCATAIVESGLDIPRANTIVIDRADMFGLAQLYQLRGRVGRARERAHCYLVVPEASEITDEARARIEAMERHTDLGSGFHIASLDLELRGAGDLLGAEQSGAVATVGVEMLCRMLDEAVSELRGEPPRREIDPELSIDEEALLPEEYIEDVGVRLVLYKRLASADGDFEIDDIATEIEDRFGPAPEAMKRLVRLMRLKVELRRLRALGCEATSKSVTIHLSDDTPLDAEALLRLVAAKKSAYKLTPDMRITRKIGEGDRVKGGLDAVDLVLGELAGIAQAK